MTHYFSKAVFLICIVGFVIIISTDVLAGVTNPMPQHLQMNKYEVKNFSLEIQNIHNNFKKKCQIYPVNISKNIAIDLPSEITVEKKSKKKIFGQVKAIQEGNYSIELCAECKNIINKSLAMAYFVSTTCGLYMEISVSSPSKKSKENNSSGQEKNPQKEDRIRKNPGKGFVVESPNVEEIEDRNKVNSMVFVLWLIAFCNLALIFVIIKELIYLHHK